MRPLSEAQARKATRWLVQHFGKPLQNAVAGTPFSVELLCAIACQETASLWLKFIDLQIEPRDVLSRCIGDASGDVPNTSRSAFPRNTAAFRAEYGDAFTDLLIAESNAMRALRGMAPKPWVYKGYGLFQFDLQHVRTDERFFRERRWHDLSECLSRAVAELTRKFRAKGELWAAVKAYNGSGPRAEEYKENVRVFSAWARDEIGRVLAAPPPPSSARAPAPVPEAATPRHKPRTDSAPQTGRRMMPSLDHTRDVVRARCARFEIDREVHPVIVIGVPGYYDETPASAGRRSYGDAIFIDAPEAFAGFDGRTGVVLRRGVRDRRRLAARLNPGVWYVHRFANRKGLGLALRQRLGQVTIVKGDPPYPETGDFGVDIHRGGRIASAERGHTIDPRQWSAFIALAADQAKRCHGQRWNRVVIPYVLLD